MGVMTPAQRSEAMRRVKLKGGPLEILVQTELRRLGLRFRMNYKRLPGSPDIVFPKERIAVFVDGDFWHGWRLPKWEQKLSAFWRKKLTANRARDRRNFRRLRAAGWTVLRIWEHQIYADLPACGRRITDAVCARKKSARSAT